MAKRARRHVHAGFTMLEMLLVLFIIAFLTAAMFVGLAKLRTRSQTGATKTLLEKVKNGLATYKLVFRSYPQPMPHKAGFSNNESLHYYLTTAFRVNADVAKGEVGAAENVGPLSEFTEREVKELTPGRQSIVDAWGSPLSFKYTVVAGQKSYVTGVITQTYTPVMYSYGLNKTDNAGLGDDISAGEQ